MRSASGLRSTVTAGPAGGGASAEQPRDASDLSVGGGGQVASSLWKPCPSTNGQAQTRNVPAFPAAGGTRSTTLAVADAGGLSAGRHTPSTAGRLGPAVTAADGASCGQCSAASSSSSACALPSGAPTEEDIETIVRREEKGEQEGDDYRQRNRDADTRGVNCPGSRVVITEAR